MNLRDLDGVCSRAFAVGHCKGGRSADGVGNMVDMVGAVEVLAIPAQREDDTGPDTARAWRSRETFSIELGIEARRVCIALEVRACEASVAALCGLHTQAAGCSSVWVAREHTEALEATYQNAIDPRFGGNEDAQA